jgi:amidase
VSTFNGIGARFPFAPPWNVTGQPAAAVPAGIGEDGLPLSVQLVAPPSGEATLFSLAAQMEAARPWADRTPPIS